MNNIERIKNNFSDSIQTKISVVNSLAEPISKAADMLIKSLENNHKILTCGNGGSACESMHFASEMLNRFVKDRPSLPAIALTSDTATITAIANDYCYEDIFAKQVSALGQAQDILLAISTSGNSENVIHAIHEAHANEMYIIALTGCDGGKASELIRKDDIELRVSTNITARIQEVHLLIIHCLCDLIDYHLFPSERR